MVSEQAAFSPAQASQSPAGSPLVLSAQGLSKRYRQGRQTFEAVRQVSLCLQRGEILAFLGPNGAGKTTTIKMIAGLVRPDDGQIEILGQNPHRSAAALQQVGAVLEGNRNTYWRLTAIENLEYFGVLKGMARRRARRRGLELLDRFQLHDKRDTPVQKLSRGMQQKLAIAVALVHQPHLLLLDEPTLGLDVEASEAVKALVREIAAEGCAILLTTHQLDVAEELSDRVAIMRRGTLVAERATEDLIREFSGGAYRIAVEAPISPPQQQTLHQLGAHIQGQTITFAGSPEALYPLLAALQPLPILSVQRDRADLTEVFLKLVREE